MNALFRQLGGWGKLAVALLGCACFMAAPVHAKYACSAPSVSIISASYDPFVAATTVAGQAALSCTKGNGDAASMAYSISVDLGSYASGGYSNASMGSALIRYDLLRSTTTSDAWATTPISGTMTSWTGNNGTATVAFYLSIPASQSAAYTPSGSTYTDTRLVTATYPDAGVKTATTSGGTLSVSISVPPKCVLSSTPGDINFAYTSFQTTAAQSSTSFAVSCVSETSYTLALDANSGSLLGLNYTVQLNKTGVQTGTFSAQSVNIAGSMSGGQSGNWSAGKCTTKCTDAHTRSLTLSY